MCNKEYLSIYLSISVVFELCVSNVCFIHSIVVITEIVIGIISFYYEYLLLKLFFNLKSKRFTQVIFPFLTAFKSKIKKATECEWQHSWCNESPSRVSKTLKGVFRWCRSRVRHSLLTPSRQLLQRYV